MSCTMPSAPYASYAGPLPYPAFPACTSVCSALSCWSICTASDGGSEFGDRGCTSLGGSGGEPGNIEGKPCAAAWRPEYTLGTMWPGCSGGVSNASGAGGSCGSGRSGGECPISRPSPATGLPSGLLACAHALAPAVGGEPSDGVCGPLGTRLWCECTGLRWCAAIHARAGDPNACRSCRSPSYAGLADSSQAPGIVDPNEAPRGCQAGVAARVRGPISACRALDMNVWRTRSSRAPP